MVCVKSRNDMSNIDYLPPKLYQAVEKSIESGCNFALLLESSAEIAELRKHRLDPDNLHPGYVEVVESGAEDYYYCLFFHDKSYIVLIIPLPLAPSNFLDTYYSTHDVEADFGGEYARLEVELVNSYTSEQLAIYMELQRLMEVGLADIQENFYREGYSDAVRAIYDERMIP